MRLFINKAMAVPRIALGLIGVTVAAVIYQRRAAAERKRLVELYARKIPLGWMPPSRAKALAALESKRFDLLVIGGGSVGAGCALDAATRGLSVALVEKGDFASGASSKSTKLIHGGIRYLEKAVKNLDVRQLGLVREGLRERKTFLTIAPYLTREVGIILPIFSRILVPYFYIGTKFYDYMAGGYKIRKSSYISSEEVSRYFPHFLRNDLAGAMLYYDGQMDDARVNTMLVETAVCHGAEAANYLEVKGLVKKRGRTVGARVEDKEGGRQFDILAKGVINATGPCTDSVLRMDDPQMKKIMAPSTGVHVVLNSTYTPHLGLINPSTDDGRVLFILPWHGVTIAGTTDTPAASIEHPMPRKEDVSFIVGQVNKFLMSDVRPAAKNILSVWAGVRPLVTDPASKNTESLVRSHLIHTSRSKLMTVAGGKWTSYREMAEQAISEAVRVFGLRGTPCVTRDVPLLGSRGYTQTLSPMLSRKFGLPADVSEHLASTYGDRAWKVCEYLKGAGAAAGASRILPGHPYLLGEISYCIDHEHVRTIPDFVGRRIRLAFQDVRGAHACLKKVAAEFKAALNWSHLQTARELKRAAEYLDSMGYTLLAKMEERESEESRIRGDLEKVKNPSTEACRSQDISKVLGRHLKRGELEKVRQKIGDQKELLITEIMQTVQNL